MIDVVAIGNALMDVLSHETDEFVTEQGMVKGTMALIDTERAESLYAAMNPAVEISGGSAANTTVGLASFGSSVAFIGRVRTDQLGELYAHDLRAAGVQFDTTPASDGLPSGRCLIVVTPDAERTLNTYLGASAELGESDVDPDADRVGVDHLPRGLPVGLPRRPDGVPGRGRSRARSREAGRAHALGPVRRRTAPRHVPRARRELGGHPLRERGGDLRAVRGRRLRRGAPARPRSLRGRRADPEREGCGDRPR